MSKESPLVLLAEDDAELRELIAKGLTRDGMTVIEVEDGVELHDYLAECRPAGNEVVPDIVVSDVDMPLESGPHALERSANLQSPVVLITAAADPGRLSDAAAAGFVNVVRKPFAIDTLTATIRRIIRDWKASEPSMGGRFA